MLWFVSAAVIALAPGVALSEGGAPSSRADLTTQRGQTAQRPDASTCDQMTIRRLMALHRNAPGREARLRTGPTSDYRTIGACEVPYAMQIRPSGAGGAGRGSF
ncbi:hypothetical protein BH10PSE1_BH10PSE1_30650 [soil metagenome]